MIEPVKDKQEMKKVIEAVLYAAGHPLSYEKLSQLFELTPKKTKDFIVEFAKEYNAEKRGIIMLAMDDCAQLCTRQEYAPHIKLALDIKRGGNMSNSSIETLAIIAYNQPVTRTYVDTVRGVDSTYAVNSLLDRGLIEPKGRIDAPGRPMLYGTTPDFLRVFGLNSISELPDVSEIGHSATSFENMTIDDIKNDTADAAAESINDATDEETSVTDEGSQD